MCERRVERRREERARRSLLKYLKKKSFSGEVKDSVIFFFFLLLRKLHKPIPPPVSCLSPTRTNSNILTPCPHLSAHLSTHSSLTAHPPARTQNPLPSPHISMVKSMAPPAPANATTSQRTGPPSHPVQRSAPRIASRAI